MALVATLSLGGGSGIPCNEFVSLVEIVTKKHGLEVMIAAQDKKGHMHLTKPEKGEITGFNYRHHLGFIDIKNGSLVWDGTEL
jgi:hypothetical protein